MKKQLSNLVRMSLLEMSSVMAQHLVKYLFAELLEKDSASEILVRLQ
jgi:hypothetical protein